MFYTGVGGNQKQEMNNLKEKKEEIVNFFEIEKESESEKLIEEIRKYSEVKSEYELVPEIRENFKQLQFSGIGVIYEALSKNPKKWSNFFKEEYVRAFESAKESENAFEILESLEEICFAEETKLESRDEIIEVLESYLSHNKDSIRYKAIWYLGDWISDDNKSKYNHVIRKITNNLKDNNWKVRYITKSTLGDMESLPKDFKLSFMDKLRAKFSNPFKMN